MISMSGEPISHLGDGGQVRPRFTVMFRTSPSADGMSYLFAGRGPTGDLAHLPPLAGALGASAASPPGACPPWPSPRGPQLTPEGCRRRRFPCGRRKIWVPGSLSVCVQMQHNGQWHQGVRLPDGFRRNCASAIRDIESSMGHSWRS